MGAIVSHCTQGVLMQMFGWLRDGPLGLICHPSTNCLIDRIAVLIIIVRSLFCLTTTKCTRNYQQCTPFVVLPWPAGSALPNW